MIKHILLFLFFFNTILPESFGWERTFYKNPNNGPDLYDGFSILRNIEDDGFIVAGTTQDSVLVNTIFIKNFRDDGNISWAIAYKFQSTTGESCKHISYNFDSTGYIITGYIIRPGSSGTQTKYPFIMRIRKDGTFASGSDVRYLNFEGSGLHITPSVEGKYIVSGEMSGSFTANIGLRRGFLASIRENLSVEWVTELSSNVTLPTTINTRLKAASHSVVVPHPFIPEASAFLVCGSGIATYQDFTQVMPGQSSSLSLVDENGDVVWSKEYGFNEMGAKVCYDPLSGMVYLLANSGLNQTPGTMILHVINMHTGNLYRSYAINPEGKASSNMYPGRLNGYSMKMIDNQLTIMGYIPDVFFIGRKTASRQRLPFVMEIDLSTMSPIMALVQSTDEISTRNVYNLNNNTDNILCEYNALSPYRPILFTPDMGTVYYDTANSRYVWATVHNSINLPLPFTSLAVWSKGLMPSENCNEKPFSFSLTPFESTFRNAGGIKMVQSISSSNINAYRLPSGLPQEFECVGMGIASVSPTPKNKTATTAYVPYNGVPTGFTSWIANINVHTFIIKDLSGNTVESGTGLDIVYKVENLLTVGTYNLEVFAIDGTQIITRLVITQ